MPSLRDVVSSATSALDSLEELYRHAAGAHPALTREVLRAIHARIGEVIPVLPDTPPVDTPEE